MPTWVIYGIRLLGMPFGFSPIRAAFVSANGIEIPQNAHAQIRACRVQIRQNLFDHHLWPIAIGAGGRNRHPFHIGNGIAVAVNRSRRAEHDILHFVPNHRLKSRMVPVTLFS